MGLAVHHLGRHARQRGSDGPRLGAGSKLPRRPQRRRRERRRPRRQVGRDRLQQAVTLNPEIFKAYDIRGVYPDDIDEAGAKAIGTAFAAYLGSREIAVGYDMRLSSPSLKAAFIEGVIEQGVDVYDYGMLSTD